MSLKPGDKVKFMSEKGGGVVTRIISDKLVGVEIEDGFEIPTAIKDLILVKEEGGSALPSQPAESSPSASGRQPDETRLLNRTGFQGTGAGVFLAFAPHDQKILISGEMDVWMVNRTPFELIYSLFLKNDTGAFYGKDYGTVEKESKQCIATIERHEIEKWCKGVVQGVFHADNPAYILNPLNASFSIKPLRFLKEDNFRNYDFTGDSVFLFSLASLSELRSGSRPTEPLMAESVRAQAFIDQHKVDEATAVVDLHIEMLSDNTARLLPAEMLNLQLSYFNRALQSALSESLTKVVFIHGVGQGILKSEIRKALDGYDFIHYYDAPMAEYGTGATEARIYRK